MALQSTRGGASACTAPEAILRGLAPDGGLYVPESFPKLGIDEISAFSSASYTDAAERILGMLLPEYDGAALAEAIRAAYARFSDASVTPVRGIDGNTFVLELFHGPTLAFKDVALQLLPHLSGLSKQLTGESRELFVLVATSGDTGKAALEGFMDVPGTRCAVFYPKKGVSQAQRLQMLTQAGQNTHVIAVEGNFDDAQTGVKQIFQDAAFAQVMQGQHRMLSSANSINFGRLVPQVVYYCYAYAQVLQAGKLQPGEALDFAVPTGNFGNILAAFYAKQMGLPVGRLICASNANNVLADFMQTGIYDTHRAFHQTLSPSMDILISSNLERLLFELSGRDSGVVNGWMQGLKSQGRYDIGADRLSALRESFTGGWADDARTQQEIHAVYERTGYLLDPHTAVASAVLADTRAQTGDSAPCVLVGTASPFKFGRDVLRALDADAAEGIDDFVACDLLAQRTGLTVPPQITTLPTLPIQHHAECAPDGMKDALLQILPK